MAHKIRLGVNIDHVATIRNARGGVHPCPVEAAKLASAAGADGITAHLREDRRHISDNDIAKLKAEIDLPLNLEMAATEEMLQIALKTKPNAACIVPEKRQEITTEGGLDLIANQAHLSPIIKALKAANIRVSLFIDPDLNQVRKAQELGADIVELHTGSYCHNQTEAEFQRIKQAAKLTQEVGIECHAGHGLDFQSAAKIAKIAQIIELNIGHFLIGESIFIGLEQAIHKMKEAISS
ncbi:MAG: pyridoxine 5'-phosphate synthase [Proteobacteria bacterium]|nr:pyridoxine 5'-phosphate synthase [Pseudomonadota bacterium]